MIFPFFAKQSYDESLVLLVDIGSASVGAALVRIVKGGVPQIVTSVRSDISFQEVLSSKRFVSAMSHSLDLVLKNIHKKASEIGLKAGKKTVVWPSHIFCTLSSPWFILKTRNLHITRTKEFEVTEDEIGKFINADIDLLKEELKETLPPSDVRIIEKKIIQIRLNGYEIKNPFGQKTSQMEVSATIGVSSKKVIESIEKKLNNFFHASSVHFGAFPIAAFSATRDIFPAVKNFIFLDITGEATDVSLINNGLLIETVSFSRGKNFFIREISSKLQTIHSEAETLFDMFIRDELDTVRRNKVAAIIENAKGEWFLRFEKTANGLFKNRVPCNGVFFTSDTDVSILFANLIESMKSLYAPEIPFEARYLDQHTLAKFVSFDPEVTRDPFIVIESLLALKLIEQHT